MYQKTIAKIPLVQYQLVKKYISSYNMIRYFIGQIRQGKEFYDIYNNDSFAKLSDMLNNQNPNNKKINKINKSKIKTNYEIGGTKINMDMYTQDKFSQISKGKNLSKLKIKTPKEVAISEIIPMGNVKKKWESISKNIEKIVDKNLILNLHSELGEEALKGGSALALELASKGINITTVNGYDLNRKITDFDEDLTDIVKHGSKLRQVLVIFSYNSIQATDFKTQAMSGFLEYCLANNLSIIITSKDILKNDLAKFNHINLKLKDEKKSEAELMKIFD